MEKENLYRAGTEGGHIEGDVQVDLSPDERLYVHETVSGLRGPIGEMLKPVMEYIENGEYQLLIGDDASGRIPALIVRTVINNIYAKSARPQISTRFIAGTRHYQTHDAELGDSDRKKEKVLRYIQHLQATMPGMKKALVVTDTIISGKSLLPVTESLRECGISCDILTVGNQYDPLSPEEKGIKEKLGAPIFSGSDDAPDIYGEDRISGVEKKRTDLHATPFRSGVRRGDESSSLIAQKRIIFAREVAHQVAVDVLADLGTSLDRSNVHDDHAALSDRDIPEWQIEEDEERLAA